jgi:hypothetical protein
MRMKERHKIKMVRLIAFIHVSKHFIDYIFQLLFIYTLNKLIYLKPRPHDRRYISAWVLLCWLMLMNLLDL